MQRREGFSKAEQQKMLLSRETVEGLRITGEYFAIQKAALISMALCCLLQFTLLWRWHNVCYPYPVCSTFFQRNCAKILWKLSSESRELLGDVMTTQPSSNSVRIPFPFECKDRQPWIQ